ncbi:MAG: tRNA lysidine(34) synthetase TilS [Sedimentisphaerales bacterium]|nr:tRNA lysidine(34) synthetase TilS [Sedimentisphaerales bacterium]
MLLEFEKKLADFINTNELLGSAEKVLLAVSGGADSIALMYSLHTLKAENFFDAELLCAHINHQLRAAEANRDEEFVIAQAAKLKLVVTTRRTDVRGFARLHKLSIETAARQLRMRALIDIAKAGNCNLIATAHQKNDNAETIIQRLSRGTGFRGLAGIWPERVFADGIKFVRPLLCFSRDEIVKYLQQRNLNWRLDRTNADCTYKRNYIRHRLIPALQQDCTISVAELLSQLAMSARRYHGIVCERADELWPDMADCDENKAVLDLKLFLNEPQPIKVELIRRSLINIACGERYVTQRHYEGILQLAKQNVTGREIELPGGFVVQREYGNLVFSNCSMGNSYLRHEFAHAASVTIEIPGQTTFENFLIYANVSDKNEADFEKFKAAKTESVEWFDLEEIKLPLVVRPRRIGDRFIPLGQSAEKKLGKFLTAQRVPHGIRRDVLVVADSEKIIWVWPVRISEQSKITGQTRKMLQLQITKLNT